MDIELQGTLRHRGKTSSEEEDHYATFGIFNELGRTGKTENFVTIGVREDDNFASVALTWEEFDQMYYMLDSARIR